MADHSKILAALNMMDPTNDNHWTVQGEAKLDTVKFLAKGESVTREELNVIAPGFSRDALAKHIASIPLKEASNVVPSGDGTGERTGSGTPIETEQSEVANGFAFGENEIETLAAEISSTNEAILELERVQKEAGAKLSGLYDRLNRLNDKMTIIDPPMTHSELTRAYLDQQQVTLRNRAEARKAIANSGIDISSLTIVARPAPIDLSLKGRPRR